LRALGDFVDPKTDAVKQIGHRKSALAHHLRKRLRIRRIRTGLVLRHRSWRSVEGDQSSGLGLDESEATGKRGTGFGESIGASRIKNDDARFDAERCQRLGVVRNA
jgi:hypothetical protein